MKRPCPVCSSNHKELLIQQRFILPNGRKPFAYDVVVCSLCGSAFADNIPSQREYDAYYRLSQKYTYNNNIPTGLLHIYRDLHHIAQSVIRKTIPQKRRSALRVLDIGCGIGTFLSMFKKRGIRYVRGIEPSEECSRIAKKKYGINVFPGLVSSFTSQHKFDFIVMTGVLEHISSFDGVLPAVRGLLRDTGVLMIAVPDAARFSAKPHAPFDEFSIEHINYFSRISLSNLLHRYGMFEIYSQSRPAAFYDSTILISFFKKNDALQPTVKDVAGPLNLKRYIRMCRKGLARLDRMFDAIGRANKGLVVWGVGSLTCRLLASTCLSKQRISAFVDSNAAMHGKRISNFPIVSPDYFQKPTTEDVFISSHIYGDEIEKILRHRYNYTGTIHRL